MRPVAIRPAGLEPLLGARTLAVYLVSLHAVAHALLAWHAPTAAGPWRIGAWAALLWLALLAGEWLGPRLEAAAEALGRGRTRVAVTVAYTALIVAAPPLVAAEPALVQREVVLFSGLQAVLLLLAGVDRGRFGALENALVLVVLSALRGGVVAAGAVLGFLALFSALMALEHHVHVLSAYLVTRVPAPRVVLGRAAAIAAPVVVLLALAFLALPPTPAIRTEGVAPAPVGTAEIAAAYPILTLIGILGGAGAYLIARLLRRAKPTEPPEIETVDVERVEEEELEGPRRLVPPDEPGTRGRIVRAYVWFLAQAERLVARRRPSQTAPEFAAHVREPAAPLGRLTSLFVSARYGPAEPGEDDAREAERAAEEVVATWRRRRRRSD